MKPTQQTGDQKFVILALVKDGKGKFLIQRRHDPSTPAAHNKWEIVGGKVDYSETPQQAVVREIKEETGLDAEIVQMVPEVYTEYWKRTDCSEFKVILVPFICQITGGTHLVHNMPEKVAESKFISKDEISQYDWITTVDSTIAAQFG